MEMHQRQRFLLAALLALTAISALILRPVGIEVFGVQPDPRHLEVIGVPGSSQHCVLIADCETVLTATANFDLTHSPLLPVLVGFAFLVLMTTLRPRSGPNLPVSSPPPKAVAI
jgi:hypothetical protein